MQNLGTTQTDNTIQAMPDTVDPNKLDEYYFNIEFSHKERIVKFLTNSLLALDRDETGNINVYQLVDQLERIDRYKIPLIYIQAELVKELEAMEREYEAWNAEASNLARKTIIDERMRQKTEEKIPMSMYTGITKEDVRNEILTTELKIIYNKYQDEINLLKYRITLISGLREDLQRRSYTLTKLLEKHKNQFIVIKEGEIT